VNGNGFKPSRYQQAVFAFVSEGEGNGVVEAVAGSGKTTTIVHSLKHTTPRSRIVFVAYNKHIADSLRGRAPGHVAVSTLHRLGYAALRRAGNCGLDVRKTQKIVSKWLPSDAPGKVFREMMRLVSLAKATLIDASDLDAAREVADRYGLLVDRQMDEMIYVLPEILRECREDAKRVDFDDMIWLPLVAEREMAVDDYDFVFVDEAQDLNPAQIALAMRMLRSGGRVVAIGDRFQSLYGFRGADVDAIPHIIRATDAKTLPLSITYRCPRKHVELAKAIVPHIEARPGAAEGAVHYVDESKLGELLQDGDMVICRTNAPLMSLAMERIRGGHKAVVKGRDIGASLAALARNLEAETIAEMRRKLLRYEERECRHLMERRASETALAVFQDKVETLAAVMDECETPGEVAARLQSVFADGESGVTFSTVHQAKGLEAERVFIARPDLMPLARVRQEWELQQELNIEYVAYTRSKSELYFVESGE
jgi:DNA helicase-2/ATP-dependent DNA helicase PcrA